jgi:hypothetical protein
MFDMEEFRKVREEMNKESKKGDTRALYGSIIFDLLELFDIITEDPSTSKGTLKLIYTKLPRITLRFDGE